MHAQECTETMTCPMLPKRTSGNVSYKEQKRESLFETHHVIQSIFP